MAYAVTGLVPSHQRVLSRALTPWYVQERALKRPQMAQTLHSLAAKSPQTRNGPYRRLHRSKSDSEWGPCPMHSLSIRKHTSSIIQNCRLFQLLSFLWIREKIQQIMNATFPCVRRPKVSKPGQQKESQTFAASDPHSSATRRRCPCRRSS